MASIVRPGAGAGGGGGDDVDLRAELADDQVRYSDKIFAVIFSARLCGLKYAFQRAYRLVG